jgi:hypothetical protein
MNLERQKLDPRPWIGLGRVCFERGKNFWPQRFINGSGWRDGGAEIARSIHRSPNPELMFQCSRGGIFFRPQSATAEAEAYINVLPQTSRATYELENSRLGH